MAASAFAAAAAVGCITVIELSRNADPAATSLGSSSKPVESSASPSVTPTVSQSQPSEPQLPSPPATTSGGLTARTLPSAHSLGAGWTYRVDKGSAEDGYVGNGTPTLARDPHEVVMTVLPLGCLKRSHLPTPIHALESDYRLGAHGISAVGLRLRFANTQDASDFVTARQADLTACAAQPIDPADLGLHIVAGLGSTGQGTNVSVRTDPSQPKLERTWTELAGWLGGRDVVLLAVNAPPTAASVHTGALSSAVRGVLK